MISAHCHSYYTHYKTNNNVGQVEKKSNIESVADYLVSVGLKGFRGELLNCSRFANASQYCGDKYVRSSRDIVNYL